MKKTYNKKIHDGEKHIMEKIIIDNYELDIANAFKDIEKNDPKRVLLQLPDGFKYSSDRIIKAFQKRFPDIIFYIWAGTNFGSCDIPNVKAMDMIIHFGHAQWR